MAATQTGNNIISTHRTARNKIPTAMYMFLRSSYSTVLSTMSSEVAGMGYSASTKPIHMCVISVKECYDCDCFNSIVDYIIEQLDLTWVGAYRCWNFVSMCCRTRDQVSHK